jgi:hypothetical protein
MRRFSTTIASNVVNRHRHNNKVIKFVMNDDMVISSVFFLLMGGFLYGLDREGRDPIENQLNPQDASAFDRNNSTVRRRISKLSHSQCRQLENDGFLVVDNFLTPQESYNARKSIDCLTERAEDGDKKHLIQMGPTAHESNIRTDRICWLGNRRYDADAADADAAAPAQDNVKTNMEEEGIRQVRLLLRELAGTVAQSDFRGFPATTTTTVEDFKDPWWYTSSIPFLRRRRDTFCQRYYQSKDSWIGVPEMVQVATYGPRGREQEEPSFYRPHRGNYYLM